MATTTTASNLSSNGSLLRVGQVGSLLTGAGNWKFSDNTGAGGHMIMLNGKSADGGSAMMLEVASSGGLFAKNSAGDWYKWGSGTWTTVSNPNVLTIDTDGLTVAKDAEATAINIAAPKDSIYSADRLKISVTSLPTDGKLLLWNGNAVTKGQSLSVSQLTHLHFKPTQGLDSASSSFSYQVSDPSGTSKTGTVKLAVGTPTSETPSGGGTPVGGGSTGGSTGGSAGDPGHPAGYTAAQLVGSDQFTGSSLDGSKWNPWLGQNGWRWTGGDKPLPAPYSSETLSGSPFNAEYYDPSHVSTGSGGLKITASPSTKFDGYQWASGFISSTGHKEMILPATGGYVQITAKLPDGNNGAWPSFWFLGEGGNSHQNVDWEFGYSKGPNTAMSLGVNDKTVAAPIAPVDLSQGYHTYGTKYVPGQAYTFYLDGKQIASTPTSNTGAFELTIGLQMATSAATGWHTVANAANHPGPYTLNVSDVRVYHA